MPSDPSCLLLFTHGFHSKRRIQPHWVSITLQTLQLARRISCSYYNNLKHNCSRFTEWRKFWSRPEVTLQIHTTFSGITQSFPNFSHDLEITLKCIFWFRRQWVRRFVISNTTPIRLKLLVHFYHLNGRMKPELKYEDPERPIRAWVLWGFPNTMKLWNGCSKLLHNSHNLSHFALEFTRSNTIHYGFSFLLLRLHCSYSQLKWIWDSSPMVDTFEKNLFFFFFLGYLFCFSLFAVF